MSQLKDLGIEEISILSEGVNPAVPLARIAVVKGRPERDFGNDVADARGEDDEDEPWDFDDAVRRVQRRDKISTTAAMSRARSIYPRLFERYNGASTKLIQQVVERSANVATFEKLVDAVQFREGCSRLVALEKAARAFPREREAYSHA